MRWRIGRGRLAAVALAMLAAVVLTPARSGAAEATPERVRMVGAVADEILDELNATLGPPDQTGKRPRVALWPFDPAVIPVSKDFADELNALLLAALLDKNGGRYDFVARQSLGTLIEDMRRSGILEEAGGAPIAALLRSAGEIDILIEGRMRLDVGGVGVSYKALRMDGVILAQTRPASLYLAPGEASITRGNLSLEQAVSAAARHFADRAPDLADLRLGGIRYQATGRQPPFALLLQEKMSAALEDAYADILTGRRLKVGRAEIAPEQIDGLAGTSVPARTLARVSESVGPGVYRLSGTYWDFADGIEVRLALTDGADRQLGWTGRLRRDAAGPVGLRPPDSLENLRETDGLGPIAFHLTTARGGDPDYRLGEKLQLLLRVDRPAWVYCFYRQTDRTWVRLLPNAHFTEARLVAGRVATIPGALHPFELTVSGPVGTDLVKCFATGRDVGGELPSDLRPAATTRLGPRWDRRLLRSFRQLRDTDLSEASLVITVAE